MAVNQPPMFLEGGCYTAEDFRGLTAAASHAVEGITRGMLPSVTAGTRDVTIAPGEMTVAGEESGTGFYMLKLRTASTVTLAQGAASGGARTDLIVGRVQSIAAGDVQDLGGVEVVQGTPGAGAPALPARTALIATVVVPQAATVLTAADVKSAPNSSLLGHEPHFLTTAQRDALIPNPVKAQRAVVAGQAYIWTGTGWRTIFDDANKPGVSFFAQRQVNIASNLWTPTGLFTTEEAFKVDIGHADASAYFTINKAGVYRCDYACVWESLSLGVPSFRQTAVTVKFGGAGADVHTYLGDTRPVPASMAGQIWSNFSGELSLAAGDQVAFNLYQGTGQVTPVQQQRGTIEWVRPTP